MSDTYKTLSEESHILTYGKGKKKKQWNLNGFQFNHFCTTYIDNELSQDDSLQTEAYRPNSPFHLTHVRMISEIALEDIVWCNEDKRGHNQPKLPCKIHFNIIPEEILRSGIDRIELVNNINQYLTRIYGVTPEAYEFTLKEKTFLEEWYKTSSGKLKKR